MPPRHQDELRVLLGGKRLKAELSARAALSQEPMADGCRHRSTSGQAAINHRAVIAPRSGRGSEGGSSLAPALERGLIGRKFCIGLQVLRNNCRKSPFFQLSQECGINNWLGRKARGAGKRQGTDKVGAHDNKPSAGDPVCRYQARQGRLPNRNSAASCWPRAHFGSAGAVVRGRSAAEGLGGFASTKGKSMLCWFYLTYAVRSGNFHTEL